MDDIAEFEAFCIRSEDAAVMLQRLAAHEAWCARRSDTRPIIRCYAQQDAARYTERARAIMLHHF